MSTGPDQARGSASGVTVESDGTATPERDEPEESGRLEVSTTGLHAVSTRPRVMAQQLRIRDTGLGFSGRQGLR